MNLTVISDVSFERVNELLRYVPLMGKLYWKLSRRGTKGVGSEAGTLSNGYIQIMIDGKHYLAHRIAHLLMIGRWPERNPEHENQIKSDNRWENIKDLATKSQNQGNRGPYLNNTSGLKGVCWDTQRKKWRAYIKERGKLIMIGRFTDLHLAGLTYDAAAKIVWGRRFASLNFPWEESDNIVLPERVIRKIGVLN